MSENTKIEWADHSWNPWIGCTKVSPGCLHCYAEHSTPTRVHRAQGRELWGKGASRQRTSAAYWKQPAKWNREAREPLVVNYGQTDDLGEPAKLFPPRPSVFPSLCDWLDDEVPIEWLADFLKIIHATPNLDWLLLTKRPENWFDRVHDAARELTQHPQDLKVYGWIQEWKHGNPPTNVWIGTSVEDQPRADQRIPALMKIPARVRFLSVEPLLGPLNLNAHFGLQGGNAWAECLCNEIDPSDKPCMVCSCKADMARDSIAWCIVGGESGPGARPCNVGWIRDIVRQCKAASVACFVKQLGAQPGGWCKGFLDVEDVEPGEDGSEYCGAYEANDTSASCARCVLINHPKGGDPSEWPEDLRVREFPTITPMHA